MLYLHVCVHVNFLKKNEIAKEPISESEWIFENNFCHFSMKLIGFALHIGSSNV
jgi:hypothetical protein